MVSASTTGRPSMSGVRVAVEELAALDVDGEVVVLDAADEVGTELRVAEVDVSAVVPPAVGGVGLEHAPARPTTPVRASTVAADGRAERPVRRSLWVTERA